MDTQALRKARGAFFTPCELTDFLATWAIRSPENAVLEPSCGDAAFLLSAAARLEELGAGRTEITARLAGVEIHDASAQNAAKRLREAGFFARIETVNFFDYNPSANFDAVIGNPPYVRYQEFSGESRAKGLKAALAQGVRLTGLASSWAAFTIHAAQCLQPDGRLGLVLPAELLAVNYASQVRRFLLQRFKTVRLVVFDELVFPGVLEEVVLLLAEGTGGASNFEVYQARNVASLKEMSSIAWVNFTPAKEDSKWTGALLPSEAFATYQDIAEGAHFGQLLGWGETYLGAVTGKNDFFTLTAAKAASLGLQESELLPISPPGARHLRGLTFAEPAWSHLAKEGKHCYLFAPSIEAPSPAALRYIKTGEMAKVHQGYKCRNRSPWWRVPLVKRPDLLFTYMNHDRPRLTTNTANVHALNSLYGVLLKPEARTLGRELLPIACLNSLTLLGAEIVGRAYGGGLLKHEPREADLLPVPSPATLQAVADRLRNLGPQLAGALRSPNASGAVAIVDRIFLQEHLGLSAGQIDALRMAREVLFLRRRTRGRGERGEN